MRKRTGKFEKIDDAKMHPESWWSLADMAEVASFSKRRANRGSRGEGGQEKWPSIEDSDPAFWLRETGLR